MPSAESGESKTYCPDFYAAELSDTMGKWVLHLHAAIILFPPAFKFNSGSRVSERVETLPFIQRTCAFIYTSFLLFLFSLPCFLLCIFVCKPHFSLRDFFFFLLYAVKTADMRTKSCSPHCRKTWAWGREGHRSCYPLEGSSEGNLLWVRTQSNQTE